jgi:branched-chain amino acid transport system ATP-binding protein
MLELTEVVAGYGGNTVLHGVSLTVPERTIVCVLGANGAGKTTTLRAISGVVRRSGAIRLDGRAIGQASAEQIARWGVAHVPQGGSVYQKLTVEENLRMGAHLRRDGDVRADRHRVSDYFPWLSRRCDQLAGTLSGGQQRMLAIARALMMRPRLLMLDEPSLGLAPLVVREVFEAVRTISADLGMAVLVVEQNARLALRSAVHGYVLEAGAVAVSGRSEVLRADDSVRRSYLGY